MQAGMITNGSSTYSGDYNAWLLLISVLIVGVVAFVAFSIALRVQKAKFTSVWVWRGWWLMCSLIMGLSIWSAHFICILAFDPPVLVNFGLQMTLLSIIPAVLVSSLLLKINLGFMPGQAYQWVMATSVGAGFVVMHYMAMTAMQMEALLIYDSIWIAGFVLLCIVFSFIANAIKFNIQQTEFDQQMRFRHLASLSMVIAVLIVAVNLVATKSIQFFPISGLQNSASVQLISSQVMFSVATGTVFGILVLLFASVQFGYRMDSAALLKDQSGINESILGTSMEAIVSMDGMGLISGFNAAAERMFKYKSSNVIGKKFPILLSKKLREMAEFQLAAKDFDVSSYFNQTHEIVACRSNGSNFPAKVRVGGVVDHGVLRMVCVALDLSEQRKIESTQQKDKHCLEMFLNSSPIVVYTRSVIGTLPIEYVSPGAKDIFGIDPLKFTEDPSFWLNRIHPEDRSYLDDCQKSVRKSGKEYCEYRIRFADGHYRWIADTQTMVCDQENIPLLLAGSWTDIHDKKMAQLNLELNEQRLRIGLKSSEMSSWDWIMDSGDIQFSSEASVALGTADIQVRGLEDLIAIVHSEDRRRLEKAFRQALISGESLDEEYRVVWPDRSIHWIHSAGSFINNTQGSPVRMVGVLREITGQKQLRIATSKIA